MKIKCSKCKKINDLNKNEYKEVMVKEIKMKMAGCVKCGTLLSTKNEVKENKDD